MAGSAMNEKLRLISLLLFAGVLAACSPTKPAAQNAQPPLAGARIGGPFMLTNQDGKSVSDRDFAGQYRIIYFGYTYCPDVCPVDVQNIALALHSLEKNNPALAARIVPIFITVDPERDTPAVLKQFVTAFHPRLVGLTGSPAEIKAVKDEFAIYSQAEAKRPDGGYIVNHSRQAYLFSPDGKPLALLPQDKTPADMVVDIERWAR